MIRKSVLLLFAFILINSIVHSQNRANAEILWQKAQQEMANKDYQEAINSFRMLSDDLDSCYQNINSVQVEDLRKAYSIDNLNIENSKKRNKLLYYGLIATSILIVVLFIFISVLIRQQKRLVRSQQQLQEAKELAEKSIKNKSLFLSNMSHEIRTPLNALSGFSAVLTEPGIDEATRKQCNDVIQQNSRLLLDLINDVIDISCLDISKMHFNIKECNAVDLCQNVVNTLEGIKHTQACIVFRTIYSDLIIETDVVRLQQVLINILVNATKFTPKGNIILKLEKVENGMAEFSVTDTGCGIPLEKQKTIFTRFERVNEEAQGSGIGLSICQIIINRFGGEIWIDPNYTEGTRFIFTHPLKQSHKQ